jgi:hypothetical protein
MNRPPKSSAPLPRNSAIAMRARRLHRASALWSADVALVAYLLHF